MATTSDIRNGLCISYNDDIWVINKFQHVKPGKGGAFVRTKLKNVSTGKVLDVTFQSGHKIDVVRVERRSYNYLYNDETGYHFMHSETYEQVILGKEMFEKPEFLKEGEAIDILFHADNETPLTAELPQHMVFEITYTEPSVKGDTATNASKPATVETGATIRVPLFINEGDKVKINTETGDYLERVK